MELLLLCIKIFLARIADVTLGTIRTNYTVKGKTLIAGIVAFIEVFIWFLVVKEALNTDIQSIWIVISYSGGYATGTILGTYISKTFINSLISIRPFFILFISLCPAFSFPFIFSALLPFTITSTFNT